MAARKIPAFFVAAALAFGAPAFAVTDADRLVVYKQFLTEYQSKKYAEAQPFAEQLVKLTEEQYGPEELPLTNPLTNLGTIQYKLGNFPAAIESYQRTLRILQAKSTLADKAQIRPLHGLGVSFLGNHDAGSAVVALKRAADLSRNTDGLFNINQIEFIDPLIEAYQNTGHFAEAEKESLYALRVEEAAYGRASVKLIDRLDKLARWYEDDRRYTSERNTYERSLAIMQKAGSLTDLRRVDPLRGIARSFRLEAFYGTEGGDNSATFNTNSNGAQVINDVTQQRRGESALQSALEVVEGNSPVNQKLRGEVLTDLGDWYLVANTPKRAYESYADAWKALVEGGNTALLEKPRVLAYRPSISSVDRSQLDPSEAQLKAVELHFTVTRDGRLDNVSSPTTDVPEAVVRNSVSSMRRSRFAPRIENGAAVPTENVVFIERVLVKAPSPDNATSSGKAEEKPQEPAPEQKPEAKPDPASPPSEPPANR